MTQRASDTDIKLAREAQLLVAGLHARGLLGAQDESNDAWVKLGTELWRHSYQDIRDNDVEACRSLLHWARNEVQEHRSPQAIEHMANLSMPDEQCKYMWMARWVDQGCPRVVIDPKYAALLMATDVGSTLIEHVRPPWKAFLIEIPSDLLTIDVKDGTRDTIKRVLFQTHGMAVDRGTTCNVIGIGEKTKLWRHNIPFSELAEDPGADSIRDWGVNDTMTDRDDRASTLMGRLAISTCVALMDSANYHRQKGTKGRSIKHRTGKGLTDIQTFVLGRPIKVNCRQAILDYLDGTLGKKRGPVTVQSIVKGHWKYQAHGPNRSLRKFIHIEPYWRGPEDAPILTRVVELEAPKETP